MRITSKAALAAALLAAAGLYAALLPRFDVGYFTDDAEYVLRAAGALSGPGRAAGFPLLLAPFARLAAPRWGALKAVPFALTLGSAALFAALAEPWLGAAGAAAAAAVFALGPLTAEFSGAVMTEPCYLFFVLLAFLLLRRVLERGRPLDAWLLGALAAWCALVRNEGVVLVPAFAAALRAPGRRGALARFAAGWAAAAVAAWSALPSATGDYLFLWRTRLAGESVPRLLAAQGAELARDLFLKAVVPLAPSAPHAPAAAWCTLLGAALALSAAAGAWRLAAERGPEERALALAAAVYVAAYAAVHCLWTDLEARYLVPLLPFALLALTAAALRLPPRAAAALLCLLLAADAAGDASLIRRVHAGDRPAATRVPRAALGWLAANTPPGAVVMEKGLQARLYSGRASVFAFPAQDREEFRYRALRAGVGWVLAQRLEATQVVRMAGGERERAGDVWRRSLAWVARSTEAFTPAFADPREDAVVYAARPDSAYVRAYRLYLDSRSDAEAGRWDAARAKLDRAVALSPRLASALNARGVVSLLSGSPARARADFDRALDARPDFAPALLNRARVRARLGDRAGARRDYVAALEAIRANGDDRSLAPAAASELAGLEQGQKPAQNP